MSSRENHNDHPLLLIGATGPNHDEKAGLLWASYFILGAGVLAPWNAFITAADYFNKMYSTKHMDRYFTICYLPTCLFTLALMVRLNSTFSYRSRVLCGFVGFFVLLLVVPLVDVALVAGRPRAPDSATVVVLSAVALMGTLDGIAQGAVFADAATMPHQYTHAVVAGTASAGLLISVLRVITKAALPDQKDDISSSNLRTSTAIYFAISAAIELACVLIYGVLLPRLPAVKFHRSRAASGAMLELAMRVPELQESGGGWVECRPGLYLAYMPTGCEEAGSGGGLTTLAGLQTGVMDTGQVEVLGFMAVPQAYSHSHSHSHTTEADLKPPPQPDSPSTPPGHPADDSAALLPTTQGMYDSSYNADVIMDVSKERIWDVMAQSWQLSLSLVLVYSVTLSIFPGVLAEDVHSAELGDWYNVALMFTFNIADLLGRLIPFPTASWAAPTHARVLHHSAARILFIPGFLLATRLHAHPLVISLLSLLLGLTNGYLTAAAMTIAPAGLSSRDAGLVENILVLALVLGLTIGAFSGWLWVA